MYCADCGKQIADNAKFCPECGASQNLERGNNTHSEKLQHPVVEEIKRYPALSMVAILYKFIAILIGLAGLIIGVYVISQGNASTYSVIIAVAIIIGSIITAIVIYANGDLLRCFMDIAENTRKTVEKLDK